MIRLVLRCTPTTGTTDLHWLAALTASLDTICDFLLRAEIAEQVVRRERGLSSDSVARAVDGRAAEVGGPVVRVLEGPVVIELAARPVDGVLPVQMLASVAVLVTAGPSCDAWSEHVREAWFSALQEADAARTAHERLLGIARVQVVQDLDIRARPRRGDGSRRRDRKRDRADLAGGVRVAPPLGT